MTTSEFTVTGMTCSHCELSVREEVEQVAGIGTVEVSAASGRLVVTSDAVIDDAAVVTAVEEAGYKAERAGTSQGAAAVSASCCSVPSSAGAGKPDGAIDLLAPPRAEDVVACAVMPGSTVIKAEAEAAGLYRDHDGNRYWFCCAGCAPKFDANPAAYASN